MRLFIQLALTALLSASPVRMSSIRGLLHHRAVGQEGGRHREWEQHEAQQSHSWWDPSLPNSHLSGSQFGLLLLPDTPMPTKAESNDCRPGWACMCSFIHYRQMHIRDSLRSSPTGSKVRDGVRGEEKIPDSTFPGESNCPESICTGSSSQWVKKTKGVLHS